MSRFLPSAEWVLATRAALEADLHYDWEQPLAQEKCDEAGPDDLDAVVAELQALARKVPYRTKDFEGIGPAWLQGAQFTEDGATRYRLLLIVVATGAIFHAGMFDSRAGEPLSVAGRVANPSLAANLAADISRELVMSTWMRMVRDHPDLAEKYWKPKQRVLTDS